MSRAPLHRLRLGAFAPATCIIGYRRGTSFIAVDLCAENPLYGPAGIISGPILPIYTKFARRYQDGGGDLFSAVRSSLIVGQHTKLHNTMFGTYYRE